MKPSENDFPLCYLRWQDVQRVADAVVAVVVGYHQLGRRGFGVHLIVMKSKIRLEDGSLEINQ